MAERSTCYVHTQGDQSDVLFTLPPLSRRLVKDDTFTVTLVGGSKTVYKVEEVDYVLVEAASGNTNNPHNFWKSSEVFYGVSIVP